MARGKEVRQNSREDFLPAPEKITSYRPFVAICDLDTVVSKIDPGFDGDSSLQSFQSRLLGIQKKFAPENSTFYKVNSKWLVHEVERRATGQLGSNDRGLINFDRYIFPRFGITPKHFRVELSRSSSNTLVARPGSTISADAQISNMLQWIDTNKLHSLTLVDDVVAFASTFPPIVQAIRESFPNVDINVLAGICSSKNEWSGLEKLQTLGLTVNSVIVAEASPGSEGDTSGMAIPDSRDSTIFGGKIGVLPDGRPASFPYFLPFSKPTTSLMRSDVHQQSSLEWLRFNLDLVRYIESRIGRQLLIEDLVRNGFGVPFTSIEELKKEIEIPENSVDLKSYLVYHQQMVINMNQNR